MDPTAPLLPLLPLCPAETLAEIKVEAVGHLVTWPRGRQLNKLRARALRIRRMRHATFMIAQNKGRDRGVGGKGGGGMGTVGN